MNGEKTYPAYPLSLFGGMERYLPAARTVALGLRLGFLKELGGVDPELAVRGQGLDQEGDKAPGDVPGRGTFEGHEHVFLPVFLLGEIRGAAFRVVEEGALQFGGYLEDRERAGDEVGVVHPEAMRAAAARDKAA